MLQGFPKNSIPAGIRKESENRPGLFAGEPAVNRIVRDSGTSGIFLRVYKDAKKRENSFYGEHERINNTNAYINIIRSKGWRQRNMNNTESNAQKGFDIQWFRVDCNSCGWTWFESSQQKTTQFFYCPKCLSKIENPNRKRDRVAKKADISSLKKYFDRISLDNRS